MAKRPNWRYHAAKRRQFAKMCGSPTARWIPDGKGEYVLASSDWASTPASRVTMDTARHPSLIWQALSNMDQSLEHTDYSAIEQRILAIMPMSRDRVRFVLQPYGCDSATSAAFKDAFGATFPSAPMGQNVIIVCRPSQFARFLIYRNDSGGRNLFKELNPTLFTPQPKIDEIDVSGNAAK